MIDQQTRQRIKEAFSQGQLKTKAVDPETGKVELHSITAVLRHHSPHKDIVRVETIDPWRSSVFTSDHSLFYRHQEGITPVRAGELEPGEKIVIVQNDDGSLSISETTVSDIVSLEPREFMYDLSVPGPQNFTLTNGILAHNSYSIGGVSLDLEKSSKYESLKNNAEQQFDKATEIKRQTVHYTRGLRQPKFGVGVRSAFGPNVGRGILSPRAFI